MFNNTMFDTIKDALTKQNSPSGGFTDIMRFEKGNSYTVRLLPNIEDPSKTFFHYFVHGWESFATGQYTSFVSPQTFGDRDPIAELRYRIYRTGTEEEKSKAKAIIRSEKWLVNAYVVDDPSTPENNGKVKIVRFGKQLHKIIMDAISGEDSDQFGSRVFDLGPEGCNLRIRIDDQGGFPTYVASKFLMPSEIPNMGSADDVYTGVHTLDEVFTIKSYDELKAGLDEHYFVQETSTASTPTPEPVVEEKPVQQSVTTLSESSEPAAEEPALDDDKIKQLLQGLDG